MSSVKKFIIITGMSGSGKSSALKILEDRGFYCCDNLPAVMMPELLDVLAGNSAAVSTGVAAVVDIRGEELLAGLSDAIAAIKNRVPSVSLIFLEASDSILVRRYETTRRKHPLSDGRTTLEGIAAERAELAAIKAQSDIVKDTTDTAPSELRTEILAALGMTDAPLSVAISSFGFKYGVPRDCDLMFDVRFLPNPNYVPDLQAKSGMDPEVRAYLDDMPVKREFVRIISDMFDFILKHYIASGKKSLHAAFGCTGGRHRSVSIAEEVAAILQDKGWTIWINHRDIHREGM